MNHDAQPVLGFDYGARRIGVAVGQPLTHTATPLETVRVTGARPDWEAIGRIIETWKPNALVVGVPFNLDGTEHAVTRAAQRFSQQLHGRYKLPVHTVDERLSSHEAHGLHPMKRRSKQDLDSLAAQVILHTWLQDLPRRADS
ncbi:MAG: Holliday junction resolvase RuvX [Gammaproteobacteria bacterium]